MSETTTAAPELPQGCARELQIAVPGCMKAPGGETMFLDEDDDFAPGVVKLAVIRPRLAIVERPGERAKGKPRRFTAYQIAEMPCTPFKLDPDRALFVLSEQGFYTPPDWSLTLLRDPREWFNATLTTLDAALEQVLPVA